MIPTNCTAQELALLQWGSSYVTLNPVYENGNYSSKTNSMSQWGNYLIPGLNQAPEFGYYAMNTHAFNETEASTLNQS